METKGIADEIAEEITLLHKLKADIECMARRKEALAVRYVRAEWDENKEQEASRRFDLQMFYTPLVGHITYPKFREEYIQERRKDIYPPEAILFFDAFVSECYLGKNELDYLEEVFAELNAKDPLGFKSYEDLCLKIALIEREMFEHMDLYMNSNNGVPKAKGIPPIKHNNKAYEMEEGEYVTN